jgi:hypothetical protein
MNYPKSYHIAINHLVHHGAWGHASIGRQRCAQALRDLRRAGYGAAIVHDEWRHMRFIAGQMPRKSASQKGRSK